jgi:hypothetical protein
MRLVATAVVISTLSLTCAYARASGLEGGPTALAVLQTKADQAQPRDRCFLYAKLVSQMTDLVGQQFSSGDFERASETLKLVQQYAEKIHTGVADDSKKLRDAELLMQRTSFRLKGILGGASYEDRPALEATLKQLNQVQAQLMMQVFKKCSNKYKLMSSLGAERHIENLGHSVDAEIGDDAAPVWRYEPRALKISEPYSISPLCL